MFIFNLSLDKIIVQLVVSKLINQCDPRALRAPGITLINYNGDNISKYVCPTAIIDIARKITKFVNL